MPSKKLVFDLKSDQFPTLSKLTDTLAEFHYSRTHLCCVPGDFAVRGGIVDVFPINHTNPIRIEYFGNEIERLNSFSIQTQRSLTQLTETTILPISKNSLPHYILANSHTASDTTLLSDIAPGDYVVHEDHGIGRFDQMVRLKLTDFEGEYLLVRYKGEDKLYVPLEQIGRLSKYSSGDVAPKIHSLSGSQWQSTCSRVRRALEELSKDVVELAKLRSSQEGFSFQEDSVYQIELESAFAHTDTPDQTKSMAQIKQDMESNAPMDRLICGDVGYGKTEIILRATFKACENIKQVAILVPTTILAEQHYLTFKKRFEPFPYRVEMLSRFNSKEKQRTIITDLAKGKIDVVIGTHRLLQQDVRFRDLGLLIVDEEQRFGVTHKEKIKQLAPNVDMLSVSATPIPRTLYMALTGGKQLSTIATPPPSRKPVLTTLGQWEPERIKAAILHELKRNGQVFYVYNHVQKMAQKLAQLKTLLPKARVEMIHGQLSSQDLEDVLLRFMNKKIDVLVASTIIENGIDIPGANTLIIENVQNFGLSQIHQLRGRVGRTDVQGYAYLLYPNADALSDIARKRLAAIKEYTSLGSGYQLALKDLEIRGAGTLLGKKQHGHMTSVGFDLYCKLLDEVVKGPTLYKEPPVFRAYIPESYIDNERERLAVYQRLAKATTFDELHDLQKELEDRYGKPPRLVQTLFMSIQSALYVR